MTDTTLPRKRGRPAKGKRGTFAFRVTDSLRAKLVAEAAVSHRSVSEEIELRLEQSFFIKEVVTATIESIAKERIAAAEYRRELAGEYADLNAALDMDAYAALRGHPQRTKEY